MKRKRLNHFNQHRSMTCSITNRNQQELPNVLIIVQLTTQLLSSSATVLYPLKADKVEIKILKWVSIIRSQKVP